MAAVEEALAFDFRGALEDAADGISRITEIVGALKSFAHPGSAQAIAFDLNATAKNAALITRGEWKYVAEIHWDLAADLPLLHGNPGEIHQLFVNLIVNAAHAIEAVSSEESPTKGRIDIATRAVGAWAEIAIEDSGVGIPESMLERIFDARSTTKPVGKGSGWGLAIAKAIVEGRHGGALRAENRPVRGAALRARIPLRGSDAEAGAGARDPDDCE